MIMVRSDSIEQIMVRQGTNAIAAKLKENSILLTINCLISYDITTIKRYITPSLLETMSTAFDSKTIFYGEVSGSLLLRLRNLNKQKDI